MAETISQERLEAFAAATKEVGHQLSAPALYPDPKREDWSARAPMLREHYETLLPYLNNAPALVAQVEPQSERRAAAEVIFGVLEELATVMALAGLRDAAGKLLFTCQRLAESLVPHDPEHPDVVWWRTCVAVPDLHASLRAASWLVRRGRESEADTLLKKFIKDGPPPPLRAAAQQLLDRPRPITNAPTLFTLNSVGFGVYGERDMDEYGTYVTTHCFCILFIPLFPLSAYRVKSEGGGRYQFFAKVPLSRFARGWQLLCLGGAAAAMLLLVLTSFLNDPHRLGRNDLEDAQALAATDPDAALSAYVRVFHERMSSAPTVATAAAERATQLALADVPSPMTLEHLPRAEEAIQQFEQLTPASARGDEAETLLTEQLKTWLDQLGRDDPEHASAQLELMRLAEDAELPVTLELQDRHMQATLVLIAERAEAWPALALADMAPFFPATAALHSATPLVERLLTVPSLASEHSVAILAWAQHAQHAQHAQQGAAASLAARAEQVLQAVREAESREDRMLALATEDAAVVHRAFVAHPADHQVVAMKAAFMRGAGESEAALGLLEALGAPGLLHSDALMVRVNLLVDLERLTEADQLLGAWVEGSLPRYLEATRAYREAATAFYDLSVGQAEQGTLPSPIQQQVNDAPSDDAARAVFSAWVTEQMAQDPRMTTLREAALALGSVVEASVRLGMVRLRLANEASEPARTQYFAGAESAFLGVRDEAEGMPEYHIGLGQVLHRLGRAAAGDEEFANVLTTGTPELRIAVASAYRDLGLEERSREITTQVYEATTGDTRDTAAAMLANLGRTLDERELWLSRASQTEDAIRLSLAEVQGQRAIERGEFRDAASALERAARGWEEGASRDATRSNNAAVAWEMRYEATADVRDLERALRMLEQSLRLSPDAAITVLNTAGAARALANARLLARHVRAERLRFTSDETEILVTALLAGSLASEARGQLAADPAMRRSLDMLRQVQVLAPQRNSGFLDELHWYEDVGDTAGIASLEGRIVQMEWEAGGAIATRNELERGVFDESAVRELNADVVRAEARLQEARASQDAEGAAAAALVLGQSLTMRHWYTRAPADLDGAITNLEAARSWPALDVRSDLGTLLLTRAMVRASMSDAALGAALAEGHRQYDTLTLLHRYQAGGGNLDALRRDPDVASAVAVRGLLGGARSTDDVLWREVVRSGPTPPDVRSDATARRHAEARARLRPASRSAEYELAWFGATAAAP